MKKNLSAYFITGIFAITFVFPTTSCDKCGVELCDLISGIAVNTVLNVTVGTPFDVPNIITNVESTLLCGGDALLTETAGSSMTNFKLEEQQQGGGYETVFSNNYYTPPIPSTGDNAQEGTFTTTINQPGTYRVITFADAEVDVSERVEDNNESAPVGVGKTYSEALIYVSPNPDPGFQKTLEGKPIVEVHFSGYRPAKNY